MTRYRGVRRFAARARARKADQERIDRYWKKPVSECTSDDLWGGIYYLQSLHDVRTAERLGELVAEQTRRREAQ